MVAKQEGRSSRSSTRTLERGLAILDCYDFDHWGRTLTDICMQTGLPKATAFRLAKTLEQCGYLTMDSVTNRYCLGPRMIKAAYVMVSHSELVGLAHPLLETLVRETGETAVLTGWAAERSITLDYVLTPRPFKPYVRVGQMLNDFHNAHTQVFLAFLPAEDREVIISRARDAALEGIPPDPSAMEGSLNEVRLHGLAYDLEGRTKGLCGMAAPAFDATGQVRATIGVIAPTERFMAGMKEYAAPLKKAALALSGELGHMGTVIETSAQ